MSGIASKPALGQALGQMVQDGRVFADPALQAFFDELELLLNSRILGDAVSLPSYTVASVPAASEWGSGMIFVSDEASGAVPAFSDGTNWRRVTDRAVIS